MSDSTYPYPPTSLAGRVIARERAKNELVDPRPVGDLLPEAIARIEAEAERQRKAAPYLAQYERGLLTVADLVYELIEHVLN